ncbi:MBOAT family O-acyltransferase [Helicobacter kayseriensis]|uniref:MBOAT family O-acyltransferase n=1 Tax=Helicobacter kayseriensis TaxID=2905877 RepID=UPI001E58B611|nr:MBOAT family O-acyltransferase [Helicobacter kayseriensis]MCE3047279.1 MBOAT family protein [Helicobacter kayseriensis]MCE3048650.1 MBOAT family protein [Helicobacter kayseriensis]
MLFNSYVFIFAFLPIALCGYFLLLRFTNPTLAKCHLILASFFFYGYWNLKYIPLLLGSIIINYWISSKVGGGVEKKKWLVAGIIFNLSLLGFFKYTDFFLENFNLFFNTSIPLPHILLPLAISFFTFQQIAYLCDSYHNQSKDHFLDYCLFVVFFPQLIAGPIVHHKEMMPQFKSIPYRWFHVKHLTKGLFIFAIGLFKKAVIADTFAIYANNGFSASLNGAKLNFFESWLTSLSYSFQLYFDFSGYCDMAIGIALFFNIVLPINFNSPYKALNIQDFWKRWHITLGRFLTQYLYVPLGGSQFGKLKTLRNIAIVFILSGLWHGAGWGFIIWGILHALAMMIHRIYGYILEFLNFHPKNWIYKFLCWILTFNFINISWIFFRSENPSSAINILKGMIGKNGVVLPSAFQEWFASLGIDKLFGFSFPFQYLAGNPTNFFKLLICFCIFAPIVFFPKNSSNFNHLNSYKVLLFASFLFWYALIRIGISPYQEFIYFNF